VRIIKLQNKIFFSINNYEICHCKDEKKIVLAPQNCEMEEADIIEVNLFLLFKLN
jgi:hypothetical protein